MSLEDPRNEGRDSKDYRKDRFDSPKGRYDSKDYRKDKYDSPKDRYDSSRDKSNWPKPSESYSRNKENSHQGDRRDKKGHDYGGNYKRDGAQSSSYSSYSQQSHPPQASGDMSSSGQDLAKVASLAAGAGSGSQGGSSSAGGSQPFSQGSSASGQGGAMQDPWKVVNQAASGTTGATEQQGGFDDHVYGT